MYPVAQIWWRHIKKKLWSNFNVLLNWTFKSTFFTFTKIEKILYSSVVFICKYESITFYQTVKWFFQWLWLLVKIPVVKTGLIQAFSLEYIWIFKIKRFFKVIRSAFQRRALPRKNNIWYWRRVHWRYIELKLIPEHYIFSHKSYLWMITDCCKSRFLLTLELLFSLKRLKNVGLSR